MDEKISVSTVYAVETASDIVSLQSNVTRKLETGWMLVGGVSVSYVPRHITPREVQYAQALIFKRVTKESNE